MSGRPTRERKKAKSYGEFADDAEFDDDDEEEYSKPSSGSKRKRKDDDDEDADEGKIKYF